MLTYRDRSPDSAHIYPQSIHSFCGQEFLARKISMADRLSECCESSHEMRIDVLGAAMREADCARATLHEMQHRMRNASRSAAIAGAVVATPRWMREIVGGMSGHRACGGSNN